MAKKFPEDYNGVYDKRLLGLYNGRMIYYDKDHGYTISGAYLRKPSATELVEIKRQFGDLEDKCKD